MSAQLIQALQNPALYNHPVSHFTLLETYTSWVLLTGEYAYKIKKPVDFQFLDYSTLEKRYQFCLKEVSLNKTEAPEIYLDVVGIYGNPEQPSFSGSGQPFEYAVKMREFPQDVLLNTLLKQNAIAAEAFDKLAQRLATFHAKATRVATDSFYGTPAQIHGPVKQNFDQIRPLLTDANDLQQLAFIESWAEQQYQALQKIFHERKQQGFVRECHGDVHLGNILLYNNDPIIFDCIEFNEEFRWTDVMADLGFLTMDLESLQRFDLAYRVINAYFAQNGEYSGLQVLPYYQSYRAMVRAKVAQFRLTQADTSPKERIEVQTKYRDCISLALRYAQLPRPALIITHGFSGSGKSTVARFIVEQIGVIHLSSDIERKRLFGMQAHARNNEQVNQGIYAPEVTEQTYARLLELANIVLHSGYSVIVDATFLKANYRTQYQQLAQQMQVPFIILHCNSDKDVLHTRVKERHSQANDPSEAYPEVLAMQLDSAEELTSAEQRYTLVIDVINGFDKQSFAHQLQQFIARPNI